VLLPDEKIGFGYTKYPASCRHIVENASTRSIEIAISFNSSDPHMLYFATPSLSQYCASVGSAAISRYPKYTSISLSIDARTGGGAARALLSMCTYISSFAKRNIYNFRAHGAKHSRYDKNVYIHLTSSSISSEGYYDAYFYGVVDANLSYDMRIRILFGNAVAHRYVERLPCSTLSLPFSNVKM
jgi:hypothetical protein